MNKEAMKLALEALENSIDLVEEDYANAVNLYGKYPSRAKRLIGMETMRDDHRKAITALREALAEQPAPVQQEPVVTKNKSGITVHVGWDDLPVGTKLYTSPPAQQEPVKWGKPTDEMVQAATDEYDEWASDNKGTTECIRAMLGKALRASPQPAQRKPLTDDEIDNTTRKQVDALLDHIYEYGTAAEGIDFRVRAIARAIEAAHGIGEKK